MVRAGHPGRANRRVDGENGDRTAATPGLGLGGRRPPRSPGPRGTSHLPRRPRRDAAPHASLHRRADRHREGGGLGRPPLLPALRGGSRPPAPLLPRAEVRPRHQAFRHHGHRRRPGVRLARSRHPQVQPPVPRRGRGHLRLRATRVERPVPGHQGGAARPPAHPAPERAAALDARPPGRVDPPADRPPEERRPPATPLLPRLPGPRQGARRHPHRPSDPRVGRDRQLPAPRQHQPARQQLRRLLFTARRATPAARHAARELPLRLDRPARRHVPRGLRRRWEQDLAPAADCAGVAWLQGEPMNRQGRGSSADSQCGPGSAAPQCGGSAALRRLERENNVEGGLDPFVYPRFLDLTRKGQIAGRLLQLDTFNLNLGLDVNRFIRSLNQAQTFFFSTQFFYKHVFDSPGDLVLPVVFRNVPVDKSILIVGTGCRNKQPCKLRPRLFHLQDDQFLHTLLITTSYYGGRIVPAYTLFYDWQGAILNQPGVAYVRDPFRFIFDYTRIDGPPTGQVGTLRDRDNVRFQVEFVF